MAFVSRVLALVVAGAAWVSVPALAGVECKEESAGLKARAKISCEQALKKAIERFPRAKVESAEIEEEHGKLVYSFDLRTEQKAGIDEVQVDAKTGEVVSVEHEGPAEPEKP